MIIARFTLVSLLALSGCGLQLPQPQTTDSIGGPRAETDLKISLAEARREFKTKLVQETSSGVPLPEPPDGLFRIVQFDAPLGKMSAYLTPNPGDARRHPAIIWITGGDCNTISQGMWDDAPPENDQTARAFREAGIAMMLPTLRGGNDNPGFREAFYGEVDDIVAAADYLATQEFVDSERIFLGGHSSGGTLVLLTAAASDRFRATFSLGPTNDIRNYPSSFGFHLFDTSDPREFELRAPGRWLHSMKRPVFIFEGTAEPAFIDALNAMAQNARNPLVHFHPVKGFNHYNIFLPVTRLIARKILRDDGPATNIVFSERELNTLTRQ